MSTKKHPLEVVISAVDRATQPLKRVEKAIDRVFAPVKKLRGQLRLKYGESGIPKFTQGFGRLGSGIWASTRALGALFAKLTLVGGAAVGGAFAIARSWAVASDEVAKTSMRLGISTEKLERWRYAAESSGIEGDAFTVMLQSLGVRVAEAAAGIGEGGAALDALGISSTDTQGRVKDLEEILPEIADKLSTVENESVRNAIAMRLFEAEGISMVQMLADGSAGLAKMEARAKSLGVGMTSQAAKGGERFMGAMTDLIETLKALRNTIGAELAPTISQFFEDLTTRLVGNREKVQQWVRDFMGALPARLQLLQEHLTRLWASMQPLITRLGTLKDWLSQNNRWIGALGVAAGALAAVLLGPLALALATVASAVLALGVAILTTPLGIFMLIAASMATGLTLLGEHWDWLGDRIDDVITWIVDKLKALQKWSVDILDTIGGAIASVFGGGGELDAAVKTTVEVQERAGRSSTPPPTAFDPSNFDFSRLSSNGAAPAAAQEPGEITLTLENLPEGSKVERTKEGSTPVNLNLGYNLPVTN